MEKYIAVCPSHSLKKGQLLSGIFILDCLGELLSNEVVWLPYTVLLFYSSILLLFHCSLNENGNLSLSEGEGKSELTTGCITRYRRMEQCLVVSGKLGSSAEMLSVTK